MSGGTGLPNNPLVLQFFDYQQRELSLTIDWNPNNQNITGATAVRDPGCLYQTLYWGIGPDQKPNSSTMTYATIPSGTTSVSAAQIKQMTGFSTILQVTAIQITAGP